MKESPPLVDLALPDEADNGSPMSSVEMAAASEAITRETIIDPVLPKEQKELYFRSKYGVWGR